MSRAPPSSPPPTSTVMRACGTSSPGAPASCSRRPSCGCCRRAPTCRTRSCSGGHSRGAALAAGTGLGVLTLAGAAGTSLIAQHHIAYALALSAGVTIYVAASDLIPEVNREDNAPGLAYTVFGGLLFFVIVDWAFSELLGH